MIRRFTYIVLLFFYFSGIFSQRITVSGYITDVQTGEKIIGATIICSDHISYTFTNSYGYYNIGLKSGNDTLELEASYVGYMPLKIKIIPEKDLKLDIELESRNILDEVIITGESLRTYEKRKEMSIVSVPVARISVLPALGGESDMLKSIQLMPGVQTGNEASSGLYVRGGSPDQNLIVIDDVPIYYVNHLGGFVSTFNTDAINSIKLIKGGFPARYGSRLSSVLDVKMKEGNMREFHGNGMIGLIASKLMIEGPIKKDTTSYMLSARRFLYDLITLPLTAMANDGMSVGYNFYDLNAKINHIISSKDRIYLNLYSGDDAILTRYRKDGDINKTTLRWGNILGSFRWNHLYGERLFSNLTLYSTRYNMGYEYEYIMNYGDRKEKSSSTYTSGIIDIAAKFDYEYFINQHYRIKFGGTSIYHFFNPNKVNYSSSGGVAEVDTTFGSIKTKGFENAIYLENELTAGRRFFTNIGIRVSDYNTSGQNYLHYEPRVLSSLMITDNTMLKASWSVMNQYIHLLTGSGPTMQSDIWVPVTDKISPSFSQQYALGLERTFSRKGYDISVEGYYKTMNNLITYKEGVALLSSSSDWQSQVETGGKGKSYGIEFLLQKNAGKATGWIAYTYSKNTRQFENRNFGRPFPYKYDRTHDISIVYLQKIKENIQFSATWVYGTGNPYTLAAGKYLMPTSPDDDLSTTTAYYQYGQIYDELNSYRMRAYHKLDIGINFYKSARWGERTWSINIYNVYNRQNPYFYFLETTAEFAPNGSEIPGSGKTVLKQQSYFPIIPSFSYSLKF